MGKHSMIVLLDKNFSEISLISKKSVFLPLQNFAAPKSRSRGRVVRYRSAKPLTPVRIWTRPQKCRDAICVSTFLRYFCRCYETAEIVLYLIGTLDVS